MLQLINMDEDAKRKRVCLNFVNLKYTFKKFNLFKFVS